MIIRDEIHKDYRAVYAVNSAAFKRSAEAKLVNVLRKKAQPVISLVAEDDGKIVGHILFSPVDLTGHEELKILGLAPMAVTPGCQGRGIGSALVKTGLERCKQQGYGAVVVLGHTWFYPRFGFAPAQLHGIQCEYDVPAEAFMILELQQGYLQDAARTIKYHPAFKDV